ncbi:MAG: bifunctional phosphopantothenoylcysteine decarboxylase/phosphopantothenate--cysteine ligase CoaBC [Aquificaceae bacterium]
MGKVLLGVSSSIAIYKACEIVRELKKANHEVRVLLSPFSQRFISPLTFGALSGNKAYVDWEDDPLLHINLPRWSEVFLIAPCSINTLSKIALGIGDNLLTTCALSHKGVLMLAPAGNVEMYKNPAVQENIKKLRERGVIIIEPEEGKLLCEEEGQGRLASVDRILDWVEYALRPKPLKGKRVLITVGATREFIDSVRFISNFSSGLMGFSLAKVFRWYGAQVRVIAGFTTAKEPPEVEIIRVVSAQEMYEKVKESLEDVHIVVMNAAVADYRPLEVYSGKLKKQEFMEIKLLKNPDILESVGKVKGERFLVGFALEEREKLKENALKKLSSKNLDLIVANPLESMGSEAYEGFLIFANGKSVDIKAKNKLEASEKIVREILEYI